MLRKIVKITGMFLGGLAVLAAGFYLVAYLSTRERLNRVYRVTPESLQIPNDSASLKLGARLAIAKGCTGCHGMDLGGRTFIDAPRTLGLFVARNLTRGRGGLPGAYGSREWVLALKHGLRPDGTPLLIMPSHEFTHMTRQDMGAIIAYCTQMPPQDRELPASQVGPLGTVLTYLDRLPLLPAEKIDHAQKLVRALKPAVAASYGQYLATGCRNCHRPDMKGGPPIAPGYPVVPDITSSGNPGRWTEAQFITLLRTGKTPEGRLLDRKRMPWPATAAFTDDEMRAIHLYLKSL